ncbi:MAG: gliding motility-associated C-terminal protein [Bacteroidetes bacterium]|nr:gliding motility-associated C-terminal protein [Bacteroidota bacterium]
MGKFFSYCFVLLFQVSAFAQLTVNAGIDKHICPGGTTTLGGSPTASGGFPPYTYSWSPSTGLNSASAANPTATIGSPVTYTLTVRDKKDSIVKDSVKVTVDDIYLFGAGNSVDICLNENEEVMLGNWYGYVNPYTFLWTPATGLSANNVPRPMASPTTTTTYTLKITSPTCGVKTGTVTVSVHNLNISAGPDTTILQGQTITLEASPFDSSYVYYWLNMDGEGLNYPLTYNPDVNPRDTTIYYLSVQDPWGCVYYDNVLVRVIPSDELFFYTSITPNGDGENDVWVIGNLENYPENKLRIFNRYGQEIYSVNDYKNNWDGKYLGKDLPGGTYYFVFDTKTTKGKYKGSITIFR